MTTLAEIRAKLAQQDQKSTTDNVVYPHWNMDEGQSASIRFIPDGNDQNPFFWVERLMINLTFAGIKGDPTSKPLTVKVPCVEMYQMDCPILGEVRTWFKDKSMEDMGRKYWKKRSYLFQGFVRETPFKEEGDVPMIRRFIMGPQIFETIKASLMDPELEEMPTDFERGLDFYVKKTKKGQYADYSTSGWSRRETALTAEELAAIDETELVDLSTYLPNKPSEAELRIIQEMFEASVDNKPYDADLWSNYYKAPGLRNDDPKTPAAEPKAESAPVAEPKQEPVVETTEKPAQNAQDILAKIRARKS